MTVTIFSDLNGTLVHDFPSPDSIKLPNENRWVANETISEMKKLIEKGAEFVLVTGKRASYYHGLAAIMPHSYAIFEHGCVIMDEGNVDSEWNELIRPVVGVPGSKKGLLWDFEKKLLEDGFRTDSEGRLATFRVYIDKPSNLTEQEKLLIEKKVAEEAGSLGITTTYNHGMLDVLPAVGGKANAMKYLIGKTGFAAGKIVALGDDPNDLSMMRLAEFTACLGNAGLEVKQLVKQKGGYVSELKGHEGTVDILRNYVNPLVLQD